MMTTRRTLLGGLALLPALTAVPAFARVRRADAAGDSALEAVFASTAPPALAAGIVGRDGLGWNGVRGIRQAGQSEPATTGERWHLGSNTKAMTAAVFARLVEQGRARWAMPLAVAFPGLTLDPAWSATTLDDVMHHRAGLLDAEVMGRPWLMAARADPRTLPEQRAAIVAQALAKPPSGTPGTFAYGNANYVLLGSAIETITGQSWEDVMRAELFGPLAMTSAGFGPPPAPNAWGHRSMGEQRIAMDPASPGADNPLALGPAGTAHMTLADYGRFLAAMMGGVPAWLGEDSLRMLTTPPGGPPPAYAAGWGVGQRPWAGQGGPGPTLAHDGSNTMWYASVLLAPARGLGFVAVSNDGAAGRTACQQMIQKLAADHVAA